MLRTGNEKVIIGKDGWLFFSEDYKYLINSGFLREEKIRARMLSNIQPDPVKAILNFKNQLAARGIQLMLVPVPAKPMIYPDKLAGVNLQLQNPSWAKFKATLEANDITVIDLTAKFHAMRQTGVEPYLKTDTHWTPEGMYCAADIVAEAITPLFLPHMNIPGSTPHQTRPRTVTARGDIATMLKLPECQNYFPEETVTITEYDFVPDRNAEILLLGDSFINIYSLGAMNWGRKAGFAEYLSHKLQLPLDIIARNDAGAYATRQLLANELKRGRDRLAGKKVVVWEFAIRELVNGDWKILDLTLGEVQETNLLEIAGPRTVQATVLAVTDVPIPNTAPYKDHVMSLYIGDIDGGNDTALVYVPSMIDNELTPAASLRPGDTLKINLDAWNKYAEEYGSWNRSEFDDEELILAEPCWGTLESNPE